ncbi:hypothetical protein GOE08_21035, partial [Sinorhizobium medicae]|nr:hypothetical protein [Sinorhizobium medicae]
QSRSSDRAPETYSVNHKSRGPFVALTIENGHYIMIDPDEVAAAIPESNKTLQ